MEYLIFYDKSQMSQAFMQSILIYYNVILLQINNKSRLLKMTMPYNVSFDNSLKI